MGFVYWIGSFFGICFLFFGYCEGVVVCVLYNFDEGVRGGSGRVVFNWGGFCGKVYGGFNFIDFVEFVFDVGWVWGVCYVGNVEIEVDEVSYGKWLFFYVSWGLDGCGVYVLRV